MATARQTRHIGNLTARLNTLANFDPNALVQRERLGSELCFDFLLPLMTEIHSAAGQLLKLDLSKISFGVLQNLQNPLDQISNILSQIGSFSLSQGNAKQVRDQLALSLEDAWNAIFLTVRTLLGNAGDESVRKEIDVLTTQIRTTVQLSSDAFTALNSKKEELEQALESFMNRKSEEFEKAGEEKLKLVTETLSEVRKAAAEAGVSQTAIYFKDEAHEHLISARIWLFALVAIVVALVLFSLFGTHVMEWAGVPEPAENAAYVVQIKYLTQKGLIVFGLLFGLIWASKNYGASRHNYVVNKHRSNALGSFQAFASSASDYETKSAVLIQATQSIFSPQPSGYVKTDGDTSPSSPIIEILRSVGGKEK